MLFRSVVPNGAAIVVRVSFGCTTYVLGVGAGVGVGVADGAEEGDASAELEAGDAVGMGTKDAETLGVGLALGAGAPPRIPKALLSTNRTTTAAPTAAIRIVRRLKRAVGAAARLRQAGSGSRISRVLPNATSGATRGRPLEAASPAVRAAAKRSQRECASVRQSCTWRARSSGAGGVRAWQRCSASNPSATVRPSSAKAR